MQFNVGALVLLLHVTGGAAIGLRHSHVHHTPRHDVGQPLKRVGVGVSLMQGNVVLSKTNATEKSAPGAFKNHPWATTAVNSAATTANVLAIEWNKKKADVFKFGFAAFLVTIALCISLGAIALFYDVTARSLHKARFSKCQAKVQRAHDAFSSKSGELPVCPYCVEHLSCKRGPRKVEFMCGHRFHSECSNRWFSEHPDQTAHCPICRDIEPTLHYCKGKEQDACGCKPFLPAPDFASEEGDAASVDGAFSFVLSSLHRIYPEIITEEIVQRWLTCNTETWLDELVCPRYNSILKLGERRKSSK